MSKSYDQSAGYPRDEETIQGFGVTFEEMRAAARRQFVGSIVVAVLVLAAAGLTAVRTGHGYGASASVPAFHTAKAPVLEATGEHIATAVKHTIELP